MSDQDIISHPFTPGLINVAAEKTGAKVLFATDDFFAEKENLIKPGRGVFIPDKYTDRGKWMDGWESRRKREAGCDYCIIQLGAAAVIEGIDIDTNFFLGNFPPEASVEGALHPADIHAVNAWQPLVKREPIEKHTQNFFRVNCAQPISHIKLTIFPDGGVARLRVYGTVHVDPANLAGMDHPDVIGMKNGGRAIACSDMFFSDMSNLLLPTKGVNMGDGWETKRRRGMDWAKKDIAGRYAVSGYDWVIVKSVVFSQVSEVEIDTAHFKGNYPYSCRLESASHICGEGTETALVDSVEILPETLLEADSCRKFPVARQHIGQYYKFSIFPDGGVSRLRLFGRFKDRSQ